MTPADHANTIRDALDELAMWQHERCCDESEHQSVEDELAPKVAALDALLAQAETAETYRADRDEYDALLGRKMAERDAARALALERADALFAAQDERDAAVRERDQARDALRQYDDWASRMPDAGFNANDPRWTWWHVRPFDQARAALSAREEVWTHEDRMVLGEGGC